MKITFRQSLLTLLVGGNGPAVHRTILGLLMLSRHREREQRASAGTPGTQEPLLLRVSRLRLAYSKFVVAFALRSYDQCAPRSCVARTFAFLHCSLDPSRASTIYLLRG